MPCPVCGGSNGSDSFKLCHACDERRHRQYEDELVFEAPAKTGIDRVRLLLNDYDHGFLSFKDVLSSINDIAEKSRKATLQAAGIDEEESTSS